MSGDCVATTKPFLVYVQENGIIRMKSNGYLIGRLSKDTITYELIEETLIKESEEE